MADRPKFGADSGSYVNDPHASQGDLGHISYREMFEPTTQAALAAKFRRNRGNVDSDGMTRKADIDLH